MPDATVGNDLDARCVVSRRALQVRTVVGDVSRAVARSV